MKQDFGGIKMPKQFNDSFKILAVDFDGTLCEDAFPEIGEPRQNTIDRLIEQKQDGDKLILWTCRSGEYLDKAVAWAKEHGIEFDAVNEDIADIKNSDFGKSKSVKVYADEYVDDRNKSIESIEAKESVGRVHEFLRIF